MDHLVGHIGEFVDVTVGVHIAKAGPDRVINEQNISEFIPSSFIVNKMRIVL